MPILNRGLSDLERKELLKRASTRKGSVRTRDRALIVLAAATTESWIEVSRRIGVDKKTVRTWVERFEERGLMGLEDAPRSGAQFKYTVEQRALVVRTALTPPRELGLPFGSWTFERLAAYFKEHLGFALSKSRAHELLVEEGLRWRKEENWIASKLDPEFLKKRGT